MASASCPVASRAWMISLVLHTAVFFVGVVCAVAPSRQAGIVAAPALSLRTMDVRVVLLEPPAVSVNSPKPSPHVTPQPFPPITAMPLAPPVQPKGSENDVRPPAPSEPVPAVLPSPREPLTPVQHAEVEPLPAGAATTFYGVPAIGNSVVFVIDRSASMGLEGRLERARREVAASLQRLPLAARFQVIAYHKSAEPLVIGGARGLVPASPGAVAAAIAALDRLAPEGGTDHPKALRAALTLQPDVICFLTDDDELTPEQVRDVTRLNRSRSCIHALCFVEPSGDSAMPALARQNRGVFRVVR